MPGNIPPEIMSRMLMARQQQRQPQQPLFNATYHQNAASPMFQNNVKRVNRARSDAGRPMFQGNVKRVNRTQQQDQPFQRLGQLFGSRRQR